jgi:diguanylate cyclase (GGDEF)-like protein/PAS domain S-box-containing protein
MLIMQIHEDLSDIFTQTLEQAIESVVVIDSQNKVIFFNRAAETLWGYSRDEVIGSNVSMLVPFALQAHHDQYIKANRDTGIDRIVGTFQTIPIHRKDGTQLWGSMSISKVESQGQIVYTAFLKDITVQHQNQEHARLLSLVANQTDNAIIITNGAWEIVYVNAGFSRMFGYSLEDIRGLPPTSLLARKAGNAAILAIRHQLSSGQAFRSEELTYTATGERMWCSVNSNPVMDKDGKLINTVSVLTNITSSKMYEVVQHRVLEAMAKEEPLQSIMNLACQEIERLVPELTTSILRLSNHGTLHPLAGPKLPDHYGKALDGLPIGAVVGSCGTAAFLGEEVIVSDIENDVLWAEYKSLALPLGLRSCWSTPIKGTHGRILGTLAFYHPDKRKPSAFDRQLVDVIVPLCALAMEREENRSHIHQLAFYDSLTGLPNRNVLHAEAEQALQQAQEQQTSLAVFFIDIDRFKQVNDSFGHPVGDALLKEIAVRLKQTVKDVNVVGRLSGDEFIMVLRDVTPENLAGIAEQLRQDISQPCMVGSVLLTPSASIGISVYPQDGKDMGTLIHRADMAMYQAKNVGRNQYNFFSHEFNQLIEERKALENALRDALHDNSLQLFYQPQVRLDTEELYGVEALARWHHPQLGTVSPARFIPLAEECGLINEMGLWAINEACRQLAIWRRDGLNVPTIAVNLSPISFHNLELPDLILEALHKHGLDIGDLTLEITENILVDTNPGIMATIAAVHDKGLRLSMDDFGTGYSSLSYLRSLPIQEMKLDRSFVQDLVEDSTSQTLSDAVIRIGESLRLTVVAEGIETQSQHSILKQQGYHVAQGYFYAKPLSAEDLATWIGNRKIRHNVHDIRSKKRRQLFN